MKNLLTSVLLAYIFCFVLTPLRGQTYILLDGQLKTASQPMSAKRKGISAVGKYEFGPYKIISGKEGWTKTREKSEFFSGDSKVQSKTRKSFVFTGNATDTVKANITVTSVAQIGEQCLDP